MAIQEITQDNALSPYRMAIKARFHRESSYLSIVNVHLIANTILIAAISVLLGNASNFFSNLAITFIASIGLFICRQMRLAFLLARANNIFWDKVIRHFESKGECEPFYGKPIRGGLFYLKYCVMTNGKTCKASPISVDFDDEKMEKAILGRNKWHGQRLKSYPKLFCMVYMALIFFAWSEYTDIEKLWELFIC
jgi:hypothetical protein